MDKKYRITLDITAQINEEIKGASSKQIQDYTCEIIKCFLSDPIIRNTYFRLFLSEKYLSENVWDDIGEPLNLKEDHETFLSVSKKVSPEAGNYFLELLYFKSEDSVDIEKNDQNMGLIYRHLNNVKVIHADISEIINGKKVPYKNLIQVEAKAEEEIQGMSI